MFKSPTKGERIRLLKYASNVHEPSTTFEILKKAILIECYIFSTIQFHILYKFFCMVLEREVEKMPVLHKIHALKFIFYKISRFFKDFLVLRLCGGSE